MARFQGLRLVVIALLAAGFSGVVAGRILDPRLPDTRERELIGWQGEVQRKTFSPEMRIEFVSWSNPYMCDGEKYSLMPHGKASMSIRKSCPLGKVKVFCPVSEDFST